MVEVDGAYWDFYSGNWFNQPAYAIGAARCAGPAGPCADTSAVAAARLQRPGAGAGRGLPLRRLERRLDALQPVALARPPARHPPAAGGHHPARLHRRRPLPGRRRAPAEPRPPWHRDPASVSPVAAAARPPPPCRRPGPWWPHHRTGEEAGQLVLAVAVAAPLVGMGGHHLGHRRGQRVRRTWPRNPWRRRWRPDRRRRRPAGRPAPPWPGWRSATRRPPWSTGPRRTPGSSRRAASASVAASLAVRARARPAATPAATAAMTRSSSSEVDHRGHLVGLGLGDARRRRRAARSAGPGGRPASGPWPSATASVHSASGTNGTRSGSRK